MRIFTILTSFATATFAARPFSFTARPRTRQRPPSVTLAARLRTLLPALLLALLFVAPAEFAVPTEAAAQELRALDHDDYDRWNSIQQSTLSADGAWLSYRIVPRDGEAALHVQHLDDGSETIIPRATGARFTRDSRFLVFRIEPHEDDEDEGDAEAEPEEGEPEEEEPEEQDRASEPEPADSLGVLELATGEMRTRVRVDAFALGDDATDWLVVHFEPTEPADEEPDEPAPEGEPDEDEANDEPQRPEGTDLLWWNLDTNEERHFDHVTEFQVSDDGRALLYVRSSPRGEGDGVFFAQADVDTPQALLEARGQIERLTVEDDWNRAAFLSNHADWGDEDPPLHLMVAELDGSSAARTAAAPGTAGIPDGWLLSERASLRFSDSGDRLRFATAPAPEPELDDDEKDELLENVTVDIWSWHDDFLQPHQLNDRQQELNRTYDAVLHWSDGRVVQLEDPSLQSVSVAAGGDADHALGQDDLPYRPRVSWDTRYVDLYRVDMTTGERELLAEDIRGSGSLSPEGRFVYWWDGDARGWQVMDLETRSTVNATAGMPVPVFNELDDRPSPPGSYGLAGWTEGDTRMVVQDAHDLWEVDPLGQASPVNLTQGYGRESGLRLRIVRLDWSDLTVPTDEDVLLSAFHDRTKQDGFYRTRLDGSTTPTRLTLEDVAYSNPSRAEDADRYLFTKRTFRDFPDLWVSDENFEGQRRVTEANPQQAEYRWGTAELVSWTSTDGDELQGILYKPDDFDPNEEWPMMVYFYERSSNGLHNYFAPGTGTSINRTFYVSRGYLLFVPDIPYKEGYPGESAMNAVVPGVLSVVEEGYVDRERIGVQGHSWGGYQIAYMLTRTNLFAAAEAGAPVTNMTSAYGGIRWASGRVRQMQYEQGQSRIGASLWEAQHRYIENSPLFTAYKVETPLLILHNDEDGAVPWEEGIQFFVALRRLNKPVWLVNYNGQGHGVSGEHSQMDWAIRMQQFFDHYLLDARPPVWMVDGVPAVAKGRTLGLELVPEERVTDADDGDNNGGGGR